MSPPSRTFYSDQRIVFPPSRFFVRRLQGKSGKLGPWAICFALTDHCYVVRLTDLFDSRAIALAELKRRLLNG